MINLSTFDAILTEYAATSPYSREELAAAIRNAHVDTPLEMCTALNSYIWARNMRVNPVHRVTSERYGSLLVIYEDGEPVTVQTDKGVCRDLRSSRPSLDEIIYDGAARLKTAMGLAHNDASRILRAVWREYKGDDIAENVIRTFVASAIIDVSSGERG